MKRRVIMTVGKTHSGKSTFARELEKQINNSIIIDQDNHAEFINAHYINLRPVEGPNTIKYAITRTIIDYAVQHTNRHLILCNSNRNRHGREEILSYFHNKDFESILVFFDIPDAVLQERISVSGRSHNVFRAASSFGEVLNRQIALREPDPESGEADHFFVIRDSSEVQTVIEKIMEFSR
ncbi:ATP-binding protein [Paenibacillus sp. CAU 1782]